LSQQVHRHVATTRTDLLLICIVFTAPLTKEDVVNIGVEEVETGLAFNDLEAALHNARAAFETSQGDNYFANKYWIELGKPDASIVYEFTATFPIDNETLSLYLHFHVFCILVTKSDQNTRRI